MLLLSRKNKKAAEFEKKVLRLVKKMDLSPKAILFLMLAVLVQKGEL